MPKMTVVASVAVEGAAAEYDREYSYLVPEALLPAGAPVSGFAGRRCTVPFGGGNRKRAGLVLEAAEAPERDPKLKPLYAMVDSEPILDSDGMFLLSYIREHTLCTYFQALKLLLPPGRAAKPLKADKRLMIRLCGEVAPQSLTQKQWAAAEFLMENECASLPELCAGAGVTRAVANALVRKGTAELYEHIVKNDEPVVDWPTEEPPKLTDSQKAALNGLVAMFDSNEKKPALLYGVTGSGKTEVFLRLIAHALSVGKTALVLVPEISLTAQTLKSFTRRFGGCVAALHSGLTLAERADEWQRIHEGRAGIVVGTRSAAFAPLKNIGLIVVDEEQENCYKSDKTPRYHARDIALARAKQSGALLLLCSATPSIESFYAAQSGRYELFTLPERFNRNRLPEVTVVDMRDKQNVSSRPAFSFALLEAIHDNLARREQSILLLNRRGHSTRVMCGGCGASAICPNCSVAMTYHSVNDSLICHYCGHTCRAESLPACESCGGQFGRHSGLGTQKLEEELRELFPEARILRVDMDATQSRFSHERLFGAFAAGEYDIMVGTQMVAKGLNFPGVTLVGVLGAEQSLYSGDFRGFERTFSLLTQVVGRGGRGDARGRAIVQSYAPDNRCVLLAAEQSYPAFFEEEIKMRRMHLYPPFCSLCGLGFSCESEREVKAAAESFEESFKELAAKSYPDLPLRLLGPAPAEVFKVAGKYRYRLILKCKNTARLREMLRSLYINFLKQTKRVNLYIDMHYDNQ